MGLLLDRVTVLPAIGTAVGIFAYVSTIYTYADVNLITVSNKLGAERASKKFLANIDPEFPRE